MGRDRAAHRRHVPGRLAARATAGALPEGHDGLGLGLLGVSGDRVVDRETYERIKAETLTSVRGTVQADILKEDQAQNTCIFSTEFALRAMGDVQEYFVANGVRNFYSVSISGYHIAEAGANPISQLAFTLANGFTIVEYYLARGMAIDDFAPNLSFFFSNGMDAEYAVIGRVARRIWARAMRERYGASPRSEMLKYHIQTSGRSLHAQEIDFNDIRTTLQALYALFDNCNSLHTNAYDEAITTPTEESVRRAVAIQLIINRELGLNGCENPWQGSFIIDELTDLVEEAVYAEFERLSERGGVLGAMDSMYQRGKIQDESLLYETLKHDGTLPIIGVNTFLPTRGLRARRGDRADPLGRRGEERPDRSRPRVPGAPRRRASGGAAPAAGGGTRTGQRLRRADGDRQGRLARRHERRPLRRRGRVPAEHVVPLPLVDAVGTEHSVARRRRAHRLARAERHRAALRSRARLAARRAHRLLHPPARDRARASPRWAARRTSRSTASASSRRPTSSSTSTRTRRRRSRSSRASSRRSSSPTRWRRRTTSASTGCSAASSTAPPRRSASATTFAAAYADLTAVTRPPERVLYLIWREPWMTVSRDTYISRTLALVGWETVPEEPRRRAIPRSTRPPLPGASTGCCSRASPIASARSISPRSRRSFPVRRVSLIDGEMTSWYGSRAIAGLRYLGAYAAR